LEEERIAAAIQAAKEAEEAEIKRIEEEERAVKEEKDRKKAAKKAAKDQATKEGKAVSAKDKEREARNAQYDPTPSLHEPILTCFCADTWSFSRRPVQLPACC
jgi:hypothetical protein